MWMFVPSLLAVSAALALLPLLLRGEDRSAAGGALAGVLAAAAVLEGLDLAALLRPEELWRWRGFAFVAEALLPAGWLAYALALSRRDGIARRDVLLVGLALLLPAAALVLPPESLVHASNFGTERRLDLLPAGYLLYGGEIMVLLCALVRLERILFGLRPPELWKVKFELLGAGGVLALLLCLHGHALLYGSVDMTLLPARGAAVSVAAALIAFSRLRRGRPVEIRVSREMALRSVVLLLAGVYLVGLALLGEGARLFGEGFQRGAIWILGFAGGIALLGCLLSEKLKRRVRIFIHTHFYRSKYDYRRHWLACTERLATARSQRELHGTILALFCETFAVKGALLYLRDPESGDFLPKGFYETSDEAPTLRRDDPLVAVLGGDARVSATAELDAAVRDRHAPLLASHRVTFLVPLVSDGRLEGIVLLTEAIDADESYLEEDFDLMRTLARQATSTVLNLRLAEELVAEREMAAAGKISAYLLHDLKNHVSSLGMVLDNAERHLDKPEFRRDMLETLGTSVEKMRRLVARLKTMEGKVELRPEPTDIAALARESAALVQGDVRIAGAGGWACVDREEMTKVVLNLLLNALEAQGEPVTVEIGRERDAVFVRIVDHGCGMSEEFVRRDLFKPFRTTKRGGYGIGLYQCRNIVEGHGGRISAASAEGEGSTFTIHLPAAQDVEAQPNRESPYPENSPWRAA